MIFIGKLVSTFPDHAQCPKNRASKLAASALMRHVGAVIGNGLFPAALLQ
jgi:hypothetical protein